MNSFGPSDQRSAFLSLLNMTHLDGGSKKVGDNYPIADGEITLAPQ